MCRSHLKSPPPPPSPHSPPILAATAAATTIGAILASFTVAGALAGLLHGLTLHLGWFTTPAGWGGKAGFFAFQGVALFRAGQRAVSWLTTSSSRGRKRQ
jgi:hypothetical protein